MSSKRTLKAKRRLLVISDVPDRLQQLRAELGASEFIIHVTAPHEVRRARQRRLDLIVVDVGPAAVAEVLREVRSGARHTQTPILVESARIECEASLAGVLPHFRAMPCSGHDLIKLARSTVDWAPPWHGARGIL